MAPITTCSFDRAKTAPIYTVFIERKWYQRLVRAEVAVVCKLSTFYKAKMVFCRFSKSLNSNLMVKSFHNIAKL